MRYVKWTHCRVVTSRSQPRSERDSHGSGAENAVRQGTRRHPPQALLHLHREDHHLLGHSLRSLPRLQILRGAERTMDRGLRPLPPPQSATLYEAVFSASSTAHVIAISRFYSGPATLNGDRGQRGSSIWAATSRSGASRNDRRASGWAASLDASTHLLHTARSAPVESHPNLPLVTTMRATAIPQ
jgi:hypothetical protein